MAHDLPVYPEELPNPLRDGYAFNFGDPRQRFGNDVGPPTTIRRMSNTFHAVTFSTLLDATQMARLRRFWLEETLEGERAFLIRDHTADGYVWLAEDGAPLLFEDDVPILAAEVALAKFDQPPSIRPRAALWTCSFSLMVLP